MVDDKDLIGAMQRYCTRRLENAYSRAEQSIMADFADRGMSDSGSQDRALDDLHREYEELRALLEAVEAVGTSEAYLQFLRLIPWEWEARALVARLTGALRHMSRDWIT